MSLGDVHIVMFYGRPESQFNTLYKIYYYNIFRV